MISSWMENLSSLRVRPLQMQYLQNCPGTQAYIVSGLSSFGEVQSSSYRLRRQNMSLIVIRDSLWIARDSRRRCDRLRLFMKRLGYFLKFLATFTRLRNWFLNVDRPGSFGRDMQLVKSILVLQVAASPNQDWILLTLPTRVEFLVL